MKTLSINHDKMDWHNHVTYLGIDKGDDFNENRIG